MSGKFGIALVLCATVLAAGEREIEQLVDQLENTEPAKRREAADALLRAGNDAVPALIRALDRRDPHARGTAAELLGELEAGKAKGRLLESLATDPNPNARASMARGIRKLGGASNREEAKILGTRLRSEKDASAKRALLYALTASPEGRQMIFRLIEWRQMVRVDLKGERGAFAHLSPLLDAVSWRLREWAVRNGPLEAGTPESWLRRIRAMSRDDQNSHVRKAACLAAFRAARTQPKLVRPWILEALKHPQDEEELLLVLFAGVPHLPLDAELERALASQATSRSVEVRTWVARRLELAGGADTIDLLKKLAAEQAPVRTAAAVSLATRGVWDPPVDAILVNAARDGDPPPRYRRRSLRAGGWSWSGPPPVSTWNWWLMAAKPLSESGARSLPAFEAAFAVASEEQRVNLVHALAYVGEASVPLLRTRLDDESSKVRYAAAMTLSVFGPRGIAALPRLIEFLDGPFVREAIADLGPGALPGLVSAYDAEMRAAFNKERDGTVALPDSAIPDTIHAMGADAIPALDKALSKQDLHSQTREELVRLRKRMTD